ncbi:FxsA family protein [Parahaliea aestuarii]|uniref:FxsA family protein n=1 Tax=Parahaliea aestuarii TaxID=1852021 RepID=A0A5C8ZNK0_9GAMM|nr:FxsA family protein [Parahaliea aestuarii]TXS90048.1 FxsA family protein [Parahaliea aestuarii]
MRIFFMLLPWLELATLIQLGAETSVLTALLYVFATLVLGLLVLQRQGVGMFQHLREAQSGRVITGRLLLDDMAVGFAGLLLMVPGLITDVAALVVLIGPLRRRIARFFAGPQPEPYAPRRDGGEHNTIEGSYRRLDD